MLLEELFRTTPERIEHMVSQLRMASEELGLPFGQRTRTYNSRIAQELGLWAESLGKGDAFHKAAFHAYFAEGENLAKAAVLKDLVAQIGLPIDEAEYVISKRSYRDHVDKDWTESRFKGVTAVPTFIIGDHRLVGAQNYASLERLVTSCGVKEKNS